MATRSGIPAGKRPGLTLALVVAAGLAVRLAHFLAISQTAFPSLPFAYRSSDMSVFLRWAQSILSGDLLGTAAPVGLGGWMAQVAPPEIWQRAWGGERIFWQAPFYPYWVAGLLAVSGRSLSTNRHPLTPASISTRPPTARATTGTPIARASRAAMGVPS